MKKTKILSLLLVLLGLALVTGCTPMTETPEVPEEKNYTVTIASGIENGTVSTDKTSAKAGETVKLTATPDSGYELDTFYVNDNAITGSTFTMPASNVTVDATFTKTAETLNQEAADAVIAKINAIGEVSYTPESKKKIDDARSAYDALTAEQKALVTNYSTLDTAESTYKSLIPSTPTETVPETNEPEETPAVEEPTEEPEVTDPESTTEETPSEDTEEPSEEEPTSGDETPITNETPEEDLNNDESDESGDNNENSEGTDEESEPDEGDDSNGERIAIYKINLKTGITFYGKNGAPINKYNDDIKKLFIKKIRKTDDNLDIDELDVSLDDLNCVKYYGSISGVNDFTESKENIDVDVAYYEMSKSVFGSIIELSYSRVVYQN